MVNFRLIDRYIQCDIIYSELKKYKFGVTPYEMAKKVNCHQNTTRKILDYLVKIGLVNTFKIGSYNIYLAKGLKNRLNIIKYLEDIDNALSKKTTNKEIPA